MIELSFPKLDMIYIKSTVEIDKWFLVSAFENLRFQNS
jgi:hypothetical protein